MARQGYVYLNKDGLYARIVRRVSHVGYQTDVEWVSNINHSTVCYNDRIDTFTKINFQYVQKLPATTETVVKLIEVN